MTFESGTDEAVTDSLTGDTFTIVGTATLPYYMDLNREQVQLEQEVLTVLHS